MINETRREVAMMKCARHAASRSPGLIGLALALTLGACNTDRAPTGSINASPDYHQRHPIVLTDAPRSLDIFVGATFFRLDGRQLEEVHDFAVEYMRTGKGGITIVAPDGVKHAHNVEHTLMAVRKALAERGVPAAAVAVGSYRPADPAIASPIRLSFDRLQAKIAGQCSQWPDDLGGIEAPRDGWDNHSYWNLGCAAQANFAAQVADPVDLVRGRPESPVDTVQRMNRIGKVRQSEDPTTNYKKEALKTE